MVMQVINNARAKYKRVDELTTVIWMRAIAS